MTSFAEQLLRIGSGIPARIELPLHEMRWTRLIAVADGMPGDFVRLVFPPETLPLSRIDRSRSCRVLFESPGQPISFLADIEDIPDSRTLNVRAREAVQHEQMRDFFRVDVSTPVIVSSLLPPDMAGAGADSWRIVGESLDVSGNGMLVAFPQSLGLQQRVRLEIVLPTADLKVVQCVAQVVREKQVQDGLFHVALTFDEISGEDRDRIIGCCLSIQRKHLRMRVRVRQS